MVIEYGTQSCPFKKAGMNDKAKKIEGEWIPEAHKTPMVAYNEEDYSRIYY